MARVSQIYRLSGIILFSLHYYNWISFHLTTVFSKRLDHGSSHPTKPLCALAGPPTARDDTVYSLVDLFRGNLSTFPPQNTFPLTLQENVSLQIV